MDNKLQVLPVNEVYVSEEDLELFSDLKEKEIVKYIEEELNKFEAYFKELCDEFKVRFDKNEWIKLSDGLCYISKIKSIIPDLDTQECYSQSSSEDFYIDNLEAVSSFQDFVDRFNDKDKNLRDFIMNLEEAKEFSKDKNIYLKNRNKKISCCNDEFEGLTYGSGYYLFDDETGEYGDSRDYSILTIPINRLEKYFSIGDIIKYWLDYGIRPEFKDPESKFKKTYDLLRRLYREEHRDYFTVNDKGYLCFGESKEIIAKWYVDQYVSQKRKFNDFPEIENKFYNDKLVADEEFFEIFKKKILDSDMIRARFENNDFASELVTGQRLGHWDLWDYNEFVKSKCEENGKKYIEISLKDKHFFKRDPFDDAKKRFSNKVAIDFGTKSTVVSVIDRDGHIVPIPISNSGKKREQQHDPYENPSVIEFVDLRKFIKDYTEKEGRPNTTWTDLLVSHEAFDDITQRLYNSFMIELKSWCSKEGEYNDKVYPIIDQKGYEGTFPPYLDLKEDATDSIELLTDPIKFTDPIELYAYYLGLYINKLSQSEIFSRYVMSFPINFKEPIRKKIISSFEKGIRKSLPNALLNDERFKDTLKRGLVSSELSEPAAYAITALNKYGFENDIVYEGKDSIHYAVFDFGGGTTDFDFGIYSLNPDEEADKYCILTHFGENGCKDLGGEKLVKYLAFEIFKSNSKFFEQNNQNILFTDYDGCQAPEKFDCKIYVKPESLHAMANMHEVMEQIRWIWEDPNNIHSVADSEKIKDMIEDQGCKFSLYDEEHLYEDNKDIESRQLITFQFDQLSFQKLLAKKIKDAIKQFLNDLESAFKSAEVKLKEEDSTYSLKDVDEIYIFLAGNSSKSILFNQLISKYFGDDYIIDEASEMSLANCRPELREEIEEILETVNDDKVKEIKKNFGNPNLKFSIYPPLRTLEAKQIIEKQNPEYTEKEYNINDKQEPSGKTGVAYGLLHSEHVEERILNTQVNGVSFDFYVGKNVRGMFKPYLMRKDAPMFEWSKDWLYKTEESKESGYNLVYTSKSEARNGKMKIQQGVGQITEPIPIKNPKDDQFIYIRPVDNNRIEWQVVSNKNELRTKDNVDYNFVMLLSENNN